MQQMWLHFLGPFGPFRGEWGIPKSVPLSSQYLLIIHTQQLTPVLLRFVHNMYVYPNLH